MTDWVITVMEALGGPGAGLLVALESIFPPIPSEVVLPVAGFTASRGDISLVSAIVWTTVGSLVGAYALYGLGRLLGRDRLRKIAEKMPLSKPDDIDKADAWFDRHGRKSVFFGRMVPGVRSLVSIPAGLSGMSLVTFGLLTLGGSLIWNSALIGAGFALGEKWEEVERYVGIVQRVVLAAVGVWLIVFVVRRVRDARG